MSRYSPVVAQKFGKAIALLFQDRGTRRRWVVSSTPRPYFTSGKDPVPIPQEAGWAPGPVWMGGKSRPTGIRSPDRPTRSRSLYRLSYPAHFMREEQDIRHSWRGRRKSCLARHDVLSHEEEELKVVTEFLLLWNQSWIIAKVRTRTKLLLLAIIY